MLTRVGGNAAVGQGYAVCGFRNVCMCLAWVWGGEEVVYRPLYGGLLECMLQVNGYRC